MRRAFFLILVILCLMVVSGCGKNDKIPNPVKEIQSGGQLRLGSLYEPNTLNPLLSDFLSVAEVGRLIFSGLTIMNDKGEWIADLASEVPTIQNGGVSRDGLVITYKLKQGITWHDGAPFTAEDVKFTWQMINNRTINIVQRDGYDKITAIETPDPYTVVIKFREYYAPHLTLFNVIMPKHLLAGVDDINKAAFNRAPIGTGPFKFKEWRLAEAIVFEANHSYFRGKPRLDSVIYKIVPDSSIMLSQLKAGGVDIVNDINFTQLDQFNAVEEINVVMTPGVIWEHLDLNLDNPLFQDVRVRQAILFGIDRQFIVENVLKNAASPAVADQSPLSWAYNPALTVPARDVDRARELLIQAGWQQGTDGIFIKNGRRLTFSLVTTAGNKVREAVAQMILQQLREVGIAVEVRPLDPKMFFDDVLKRRQFEVAMYGWVSGVDPDHSGLWHSKNIPSSLNGYNGQNYPGWRNAEIDSLTEAGNRAVDIETRKHQYYRIQELIIQESPVIPLYFKANIDAVKKNVANYRPNSSPAGNLWNAWELGFYEK
ncbi:Oligopeptide-binding protein AppA [bioreactor metagenome]|uniref:Oligopeptide-binding protein AppA n=1 Tax=bioreactor metagenome TaxID=1076179 RepID=A0A644UR72_9ZZZZ|nr:peptide ABC transporter substrate-binding protein [Negativicutes bacterium]